jgi:hypothetical protein
MFTFRARLVRKIATMHRARNVNILNKFIGKQLPLSDSPDYNSVILPGFFCY